MGEYCIYSSTNSTPRYTIAIPTYKRSDLLEEAIESAIEQTYKIDYEVLIYE